MISVLKGALYEEVLRIEPLVEGIDRGILILGGALLLLYLKESLMLFLSKKISILHWFLYLCAVEIFPVSFVWLSLTRI